MEFMSGLPSEGCGHNSMEIKQEDLPPLELAMDGAPSLQSSVYLDACSLVVSAGSLPVPMPEHLNNAGKDDEINDNQCEEPLTDSKAVQSLEINGKIEIETASNGAPSDQATLQECFIEGNLLSCKHDGLDNTGCTASFCHQEETQMEQATVSLTTCIIEVVDSEKVDIPLVCLPSSENHRACREAELIEDVGESATTDTVIKFNSPSAELGKFDEARAGDQSAVEASDEAHSGDMYSFLSATGSNKSSSDVSCIEEKGSHTCESDSPIILAEAKVICDHDAKPMAVSETVCSVSQGLLSDPIEEIEKEGIVGSTECALDGNGPSEISILNSQDAKDSMGNYATENLEENSSARLQSETKSNADAEESRQPKARDDCNSGDESTLYRNGLPGLNEDLSLEDHLSSGTLVSIVEVTKENIEGDASYDCEDSMSAAPYTSLSSTSSMTSKIRFMEERTSNTQCSIDYTVGADIEGNNLPQTEGGAASSECQHHGCTVDKDGGSSMDSTAGTGPQQSDGCAPVEDEEASSTGGEESASSPASIQPLRQQRKKINIHHQFVREIVKIQHDREQYDREQAGRQVQAQQAASLPQVGRKTSDVKEQKSFERRDFRGETNKQKGFKDVGSQRQLKDSQQRHSTKNKKSPVIQSRNEFSNHWSSPQESYEQSWQTFSLSKEHVTIGRSNQQRSTSIYRPPVVRESLAAEHKNMGEPETSNRQSGAYAMSSSPDSSASSFVESCVPIAGSPHLVDVEGSSKVVRSSSGEYFADSSEALAEHSAPGMGIKVTFDTEKRHRHIEFLDGLDDVSRSEQPRPAASQNSSGYRVNKETKYSPSLSHPFQDSKFLSGGRQQMDHDETPSKGNDRHAARNANPVLSHPYQDSSLSSGSRQVDHGERPSKGNDRHFMQSARSVNPSHRHPFQESKFSSGSRQVDHGEAPSKGNEHHFTQATRSGYLYGFPSAEPSQTRARAGRSSVKPTEKKSTFFERADNSANLQNLSTRLQKSPPPLIRHGSDGQTSSASSTRHSDWCAGTPNPSFQSFSTPSSQRTALLGPPFDRGFFGSTSFASANVRSEDPERATMNIQGNFQHQQFNTDFRGNAQYAVITDNSRGKKGPQKNSTKDFSSPFQAMMKDASRPQAVFSASAQRSAGVNEDSRGFGTSWRANDHTQTQSHESSQESLRRSQSDASRKAFTQNSPAQLSSSPVLESLFCTIPMQEKWGDIVDDLTDSNDYFQIKSDGGERGNRSGNHSFGASNQSIASFTDSKVLKPVFREPKQDRGSYNETSSSQKHTEVAREHLAYDTPVRKSVFERLGPHNNFQESILGPPPKMLDSRGVLKASPDALIRNVLPVSTFKSFDTGFYGSQWASQPPSMQHENVDDEGREVVVQAYTEVKQRRSKRELYVPRRGS